VLGILFSVLIGRYGCRIVTLIGGFIWFIGFASSALAPNIIVLYFTYGIVAGLFYLLYFCYSTVTQNCVMCFNTVY